MKGYNFEYGNVGGLQGQVAVDLDIDYYVLMNAQETQVMIDRTETPFDIEIKELAIRVSDNAKVKLRDGSWVQLFADEWLTVSNTSKRSIKFDTSGINYYISYTY